MTRCEYDRYDEVVAVCYPSGAAFRKRGEQPGHLEAPELHRCVAIEQASLRFYEADFDMYATAAAAAGAPMPEDRRMDGVDLLPYVTGEATGVPHRALFWRSGASQTALIDGWKQGRAPPARQGVPTVALAGRSAGDRSQPEVLGPRLAQRRAGPRARARHVAVVGRAVLTRRVLERPLGIEPARI